MSAWLLDTNVLSEQRKGDRGDPLFRAWIDARDEDAFYTSVLVVGELRHGIELLRRRDQATAGHLDQWLVELQRRYRHRLLPVDEAVAIEWGGLGVPDPLPDLNGLIAATAIAHGMTLATRDATLLARDDVPTINPFEPG